MNESNKFFLKTFIMLMGLCFIFVACLRFFMPEKNIINSLLFLDIGICIILINMSTCNTGSRNNG